MKRLIGFLLILFSLQVVEAGDDVARREHLAKAAREIHDMPLYVNAAMNSRGRRSGEYPSAGPLAHLIDFWHKGAPSIDLLEPCSIFVVTMVTKRIRAVMLASA